MGAGAVADGLSGGAGGAVDAAVDVGLGCALAAGAGLAGAEAGLAVRPHDAPLAVGALVALGAAAVDVGFLAVDPTIVAGGFGARAGAAEAGALAPAGCAVLAGRAGLAVGAAAAGTAALVLAGGGVVGGALAIGGARETGRAEARLLAGLARLLVRVAGRDAQLGSALDVDAAGEECEERGAECPETGEAGHHFHGRSFRNCSGVVVESAMGWG